MRLVNAGTNISAAIVMTQPTICVGLTSCWSNSSFMPFCAEMIVVEVEMNCRISRIAHSVS